VNDAALNALLAEWSRTDLTYAGRISHLNGTVGGGLNGTYFFQSATVFDDAAVDTVTGGGGLDWYFASVTGAVQDLLTDRNAATEQAVDIH
jgi:hypothetical protein